MPLGRDRKVCNQSRRCTPKATTWGQSSAPAITAHRAMVTMSSNGCFLARRLRRGSRRLEKQLQIEQVLSSMTALQVGHRLGSYHRLESPPSSCDLTLTPLTQSSRPGLICAEWEALALG